MFPCSLKIIDPVPLFLKSDFQNFHVPCSQKLVSFPCSLEYLPMISCSLKINGHVPLFPKTPGKASFELHRGCLSLHRGLIVNVPIYSTIYCINPLMPNGLFYLNSLNRSIPVEGVSDFFSLLPCFTEIRVFNANIVDPDQTFANFSFMRL